MLAYLWRRGQAGAVWTSSRQLNFDSGGEASNFHSLFLLWNQIWKFSERCMLGKDTPLQSLQFLHRLQAKKKSSSGVLFQFFVIAQSCSRPYLFNHHSPQLYSVSLYCTSHSCLLPHCPPTLPTHHYTLLHTHHLASATILTLLHEPPVHSRHGIARADRATSQSSQAVDHGVQKTNQRLRWKP